MKVLRLSQINAAQGPVSGGERLERWQESAGPSFLVDWAGTHRDLENLNILLCFKHSLLKKYLKFLVGFYFFYHFLTSTLYHFSTDAKHHTQSCEGEKVNHK